MADITINGTGLSSQLMQFLMTDDLEPGSNAGYQLCKIIYEYHPLASKIIDKPIVLALSKPRIVAVDSQPKEMLVQAFQDEWDSLDATNIIRDVTFLKRIYGAAAVFFGAKGKPLDKPIDLWDLPNLDIYFSKLDPLNLSGSLVGNQNPTAIDFQQPNEYITAAGTPIHPSRKCVVYNNMPLYLEYQSSAFGYTGRSTFQRALYPLKSFVQSTITDQFVTYKAGLLIAKQKQAGSIVDRAMQFAAGIKREYLKQGMTGNVLSIDIDEDIESIDLNNTDTAMTTARENIIATIAAATDVPAILLKDEALSRHFTEGSQDAIAIAQYITGIRNDMDSLYKFFDKIVMHRAWSRDFFESVKSAYPDMYGDKTYEEAFYSWQNAFKPSWPSLIEEPPSELVKTQKVKIEGINEMLRTLLPVIDPENRARAIQWAQENINEMGDMFKSTMQLDIEAVAEYEPPVPLTAPTEPPSKD